MKIGLIDVDSHNFPNLPLMKISAWHKARGHKVEWCNLFNEYDIVYKSKIFKSTPDYEYMPKTKEIVSGGTGYDIKNVLPSVIENKSPDYNLYSTDNISYGFLTRGCPRNCEFCIVTQKEGKKSCKVANLDQFWNGQKEIKLLDPNILACKDRITLLNQLIESKSWVDFTQGLDIRFMTEEIAELIKKVKVKMIHFAWDTDNMSDNIIRNLKSFKDQTQYSHRKLLVYVLTNYDTTFEFDLYRVYKLKELGYDPYIMVYDKTNLPKRSKYKKLQRWVNNRIIFKSCEKFEDYRHE